MNRPSPPVLGCGFVVLLFFRKARGSPILAVLVVLAVLGAVTAGLLVLNKPGPPPVVEVLFEKMLFPIFAVGVGMLKRPGLLAVIPFGGWFCVLPNNEVEPPKLLVIPLNNPVVGLLLPNRGLVELVGALVPPRNALLVAALVLLLKERGLDGAVPVVPNISNIL